MIGGVALGAAGIFAILAIVTTVGTALIERRYPPGGSFAIIQDITVHYRDVPGAAARPGLPVLVIHGASGNGEEARCGLGGALANRRAIYVDRPGHGHSDRGRRDMAAPGAQAGVIAGLLAHLGIESAIVVGHSWGAAVAAAMAVEHGDRVAALVLVAPATHPWPGGVAWYHGLIRTPVIGWLFSWTVPLPAGLAMITPAARSVFAPDPMPVDYVDRCAIPTVLRPWTFRANSLDVSNLNENVTRMAPRYGEIVAPTVVVTGDTDAVVAPWIHSAGLVRDIAGAELVTIPGAGHMPHHSHSAVVARAVEAVAARVERTDGVQIPD